MIKAATFSEFMLKQREPQKSKLVIDYTLLVTSLVILALGLVMVASSSLSIAEKNTGSAFYYLWRQMVFVGIGLVSAFFVFRTPLETWQKAGPVLVVISLVLLVLVFLPGLGKTVNGSTRWLNLGVVNLQASEVVKLFTLMYMAGYLVRHQEAVRNSIGGFIRPLVLLLFMVILLLLEPDYGAAAVLVATCMGMMWMGGVRLLQFVFLFIAVALALAILATSSPYRMERLTAFLNPWADPFNSGFQLTQALIAFGRGEWFGVGLGNSVQKLFYLPEAHTDFLFAVFAEETGLFGVTIAIALFAILIIRALLIARTAEKRERPFAAFLSYGLALWMGMQAAINIGVNMGILPTKGLTLPLMSYGGSSVVIMCIAVALLLRADYETRKDDRPVQNRRARHAS